MSAINLSITNPSYKTCGLPLTLQNEGSQKSTNTEEASTKQPRARSNNNLLQLYTKTEKSATKKSQNVTLLVEPPLTPSPPPSPSAPNTNSVTTTNNVSNSRLTNAQQKYISQIMLLNNDNGKLKHGTMKKISEEYKISRIIVRALWKGLSADIKDGNVFNSDRKFKGSTKRDIIDIEKVRDVPLKDRSSIRKLALQIKVPYSSIRRLVKKGQIRSHSNAIKPSLTSLNMINRVKWCLGRIIGDPTDETLFYHSMQNVVHMDEKWFFMTKESQKYYLLPDEIKPHSTWQSKRFIPKLMFMVVVARPIFENDRSLLFDGKIGIFPFTYEQPARRASKNKTRGTLEVKPIESITKEVIKQCMIEKIIPAIKSKWPEGSSKIIYIQQDNARPHISGNDPDFLQAAQFDGFDIRLVCQPPNSPDLNVLDLGFFRSIQSLQYEKAPKTVRELVDAVLTAYEQVEPLKLKYVWISIQCCMNEILRVKGNKNYKLPHIGKHRLERLGLLPDEQISVDEHIVAAALEYVEASNTP